MTWIKLIIPLLLILLTFLYFISPSHDYNTTRVMKFDEGSISVFDFLDANLSNGRRKVGITSGEFYFNGNDFPNNYILITYESGFSFELDVTFENGAFVIYNCNNYSGNIDFFGIGEDIKLNECEGNCCGEHRKRLIKISQKCMNYICP